MRPRLVRRLSLQGSWTCGLAPHELVCEPAYGDPHKRREQVDPDRVQVAGWITGRPTFSGSRVFVALTIAPCIPSATSCVNVTETFSKPAASRPALAGKILYRSPPEVKTVCGPGVTTMRPLSRGRDLRTAD